MSHSFLGGVATTAEVVVVLVATRAKSLQAWVLVRLADYTSSHINRDFAVRRVPVAAFVG